MYKNRRFSESRSRSFAPVNVGDELDLKIEAVGEKGDGIAKVKGFVIFVPNAKEGETVKVKITRVLRKVGFGEIVGGASASPKETEAIESQEMETSGDMEASGDSEDSGDMDSESFGEE